MSAWPYVEHRKCGNCGSERVLYEVAPCEEFDPPESCPSCPAPRPQQCEACDSQNIVDSPPVWIDGHWEHCGKSRDHDGPCARK